jgi:hypothetical protein
MTLLPLSQASALLGIDAKTLRHWVQQAHCSVSPHPGDARIKCLTAEQIKHLAALHGRPLDQAIAHADLHSAEATPSMPPEKPATHAEPDLLTRLAHLEAQGALLQQQVAGLALQLLQERAERYEQRLHTLETLIQPSAQHQRSISAPPPATRKQRSQPDKPLTTRRVHPAKGHARPILPLIEYTADGAYIVMCPHQGELALIPDSPEWFAWLETISSLRFLGQQGRWSAYRDKGRASCCWFAYRRINGHQYVRSLGGPHQLTLARFEEMAATLQSFVTAS